MPVRVDAPANQWTEPKPTTSVPVRLYLRLSAGKYVFDTTPPPDAVWKDDGTGKLIMDSDPLTETAQSWLFGATTILISQ